MRMKMESCGEVLEEGCVELKKRVLCWAGWIDWAGGASVYGMDERTRLWGFYWAMYREREVKKRN
jgi:hypothetical protein